MEKATKVSAQVEELYQDKKERAIQAKQKAELLERESQEQLEQAEIFRENYAGMFKRKAVVEED